MGRAGAIDEKTVEGLRQVTTTRRVNQKKAIAKKKRKRIPKEPARPIDAWFPGEDRANPMSNAVQIPASALQNLWDRLTDYSRRTPTVYARKAMVKVHESMRNLRACYTDGGVEKASLQVACALLELARVNYQAENPFLVIQQAAIFASHGTKRGNSDDMFRDPLPDPMKCTAHDCLVILGRADCFQSVYFPYEAAYLCAFVARVCNLHRDTRDSEEPDEDVSTWSDQWMVVGMMCYNVSVMIRATAVDKVRGIKIREDYDPWDKDVIDELLLARADAVALKSSLNKGKKFSFKQSGRKVRWDDDSLLPGYSKPKDDEREKQAMIAAGDPMVVDADKVAAV